MGGRGGKMAADHEERVQISPESDKDGINSAGRTEERHGDTETRRQTIFRLHGPKRSCQGQLYPSRWTGWRPREDDVCQLIRRVEAAVIVLKEVWHHRKRQKTG